MWMLIQFIVHCYIHICYFLISKCLFRVFFYEPGRKILLSCMLFFCFCFLIWYLLLRNVGIAQCAELTWQLRGAAGARQVPNCKLALQHNIGLGGAAVVALYKMAVETKVMFVISAVELYHHLKMSLKSFFKWCLQHRIMLRRNVLISNLAARQVSQKA